MGKKIEDYFSTIIGCGLFGGIVGIVLGIGSCFCSHNTSYIGGCVFVCIILGCVGGWYVTYSTNKEEEEKNIAFMAEQNKMKDEKTKETLYKNWDNALCNSVIRIRDNVNSLDEKFNYQNEFNISKSYYKNYPKYKNSIGVLMELETFEKERYDNRYKEVEQWLINELNAIISNNMTKETGPYNCRIALLALKVIKIVMDNDVNFDKAINAISEFKNYTYCDTLYMDFEHYGEIKLPLEQSNEIEYYDSNIDSIMKSIRDRYLGATANLGGYYSNYVNNLNGDLLSDVGSVLWYYAKKKPFDVEKFNEAKTLYNKYLNFNKEENADLDVKVEVILATIYAKNQMGGENLVRQDWEYINKWLENKYNNNWEESCCLLASGLAWMELYNLEKEVLRKLVQLGCSLDEEMQERLNFLESGGTGNINIYNVPNDNAFYFDSSATEWGQKEIDIFFRKAAMKNIEPEYSLSFDRWTKALPLQKGQKVSFEDIYNEMKDMVDDFDGEVNLRKSSAKAINLQNVEYDNALIFKFNSKRNKCISVLFSCEKYGRNLNLTILTLFTPEKGLSIDEMKHYALAIKSNVYMDSFKESILQSIDSVLKEKKSIYDEDTEENSNRKVFE